MCCQLRCCGDHCPSSVLQLWCRSRPGTVAVAAIAVCSSSRGVRVLQCCFCAAAWLLSYSPCTLPDLSALRWLAYSPGVRAHRAVCSTAAGTAACYACSVGDFTGQGCVQLAQSLSCCLMPQSMLLVAPVCTAACSDHAASNLGRLQTCWTVRCFVAECTLFIAYALFTQRCFSAYTF